MPAPEPEPRTSVVVPARDAAATLPALLTALGALREPPGGFEVVVVDDASTDATGALAAAHPAVTRVVTATGAGPGAARNAGVAVARGELLAFTDADCAPEPGWLQAGVAALDAGADVVQGAVVPATATGPFDRTVRVGQPTPLFETANLLVRRERFDAVGGFEPWLSPRRSKELGEDVWLGWRLRRAGATTAFAPDAVVRHAVFAAGPLAHAAERARLRFFPLIVARVPELRGELCFAGVFLSRRSASFDAALAGLLVAGAARRPAALLAALPYARLVWRAARPWGRRGVLVAAGHVAADAVGAAALVVGSAGARSVLL